MTEAAHQGPDEPEAIDRLRRRVLMWVGLLMGGLAAAAAGVPIVGYLLGPIFRRRPDQWVKLGPVDQFSENQTHLVDLSNPLALPWDGKAARMAAYVRRLQGEQFQVFSIHCTHLGCPVSWFPQSGLFLCPCHGGVYYADGSRASGPPPRGLFRLPHRVKDGNLLVLAGHLPTLEEPA